LAATKIRDFTNNTLHYAFDTISETATAQFCCDALSTDTAGNHYTALLPVPNFPREDVSSKHTMAYTAMGEAYKKRGKLTPAKVADYKFATEFWSLSERLIREGRVKPHLVEVGDKGFAGVLEGLQRMREGRVSGTKLVYRVADTPGL
jgi:hypothetical protein